ncbi:MAG TPA: hypothetical protein VE007_12700 [Thermoanaerobaculia bacterium]|nr:hypothetical protein [Thermoanaerobaculia bacterium]
MSATRKPALSPAAARCRRRFLRFFPGGFRDPTYLDWERNYKEEAHRAWTESLKPVRFRSLLAAARYAEIASEAVRIESRTNLLFSFEKMALRDAVRTPAGAAAFSKGLYDFLHGRGAPQARFERWCETVASLPRRQTRVLTWPVVTVFPFLGRPEEHIYLKPTATKRAAERCGCEFAYRSRPDWETYASLLDFAGTLRRELADLHPADMIDIQSYIWVAGSDEYDEME